MLSITDRHRIILEKLNRTESVQVAQLSKELKVSAVTIRKDLKLLEDKGLLFRSHGGATVFNPYINEQPLNEKKHIRSDEKKRIGQAAARLVTKERAIIIASGTSVSVMAEHVQPAEHLIAITASLNVALELNRHEKVEVIQLGGTLRKTSDSAIGPHAVEMLKHFSCSKLFLGIDGLDLDFGLTTTSSQEAHLNREMIKAAQQTIVLTDSSKFGRRGFEKICNLKDISHIITDKNASPKYVEAIREMGIELTLV